MSIAQFSARFEHLLLDVLKGFDFSVQSIELFTYNKRNYRIDFAAERNGYRTLIEVKFYRSDHVAGSSLREAIRPFRFLLSRQDKPVSGLLIISAYATQALKNEFAGQLGIILWDRNDLHNLIKYGLGNTQLLEDFEQLLNEAKQGIDTEGVFADTTIENKVPGDYFKALQQTFSPHVPDIPEPPKRNYCADLSAVFPGKPGWSTYEKLGIEILKHLFEKDLSNWSTQQTTDDELSRFDMICRVISNNDFWKNLIQSFQSRYVLFEFKNYSDAIGQDEVYTTERYLYLRGLRSVGFIIAPKGGNPQAQSAAKGALREHGKLILILTNADLCKMLDMKADGREPSDYLSDKLDDFLISLSR